MIECDSVAHHTNARAYAADRERDRKLWALGYVVLRLTHGQVMYDWEVVEADILACVRAGGHRKRVRGRPVCTG